MKTTEEMIEVMQAYLRGEKIQRFGVLSGWAPDDGPLWDWSAYDYRITPPPAPTQDTIPWDAIDARFKWAARDADGEAYVYSERPSPYDLREEWSAHAGVGRGVSNVFSGYIPGTIDWRESLQERPAAEEKRP